MSLPSTGLHENYCRVHKRISRNRADTLYNFCAVLRLLVVPPNTVLYQVLMRTYVLILCYTPSTGRLFCTLFASMRRKGRC